MEPHGSVSLSSEATAAYPVLIGDVNYPEYVTEHSLDVIKHYNVRDDDVWICAFPKAGSHWLGEIVNLILVDGYKERIDRSKHHIPMSFERHPKNKPVAEAAKTWSSPRVLNTHVQEQLLPTQLCEGRGKVIYIVRNPKDSAVSYYNFLKSRDYPILRDFDTFIELYGTNQMRFGSWYDHTFGYWNNWRGRRNFLYLKYEDMKNDLQSAVSTIAKFLARPLDAESTRRVLHYTSVEEMMKTFFVSGETNYSEYKKINKTGPPDVINKGIIGNWKNMFTVAQSEKFDRIYRERMVDCSLTLQFD